MVLCWSSGHPFEVWYHCRLKHSGSLLLLGSNQVVGVFPFPPEVFGKPLLLLLPLPLLPPLLLLLQGLMVIEESRGTKPTELVFFT